MSIALYVGMLVACVTCIAALAVLGRSAGVKSDPPSRLQRYTGPVIIGSMIAATVLGVASTLA